MGYSMIGLSHGLEGVARVSKAGGARNGAGRPVGSLNRRNAETVTAALAEGLTPIEYMLTMMRDKTADEKSRAWAAEKAAPFVHGRPAPVPRTVELTLPDISTPAGLSDAISAIMTATASGKIAPSEAHNLVSIVEAQRKTIETNEILERIERLEKKDNAR
jgi:hypothetical protein